ncbi:MAG: transketolase [Candidatus Aenigmarchaeota archaeon]|nr:transketolase [Candidatus Aenigmarchaeota archaeon]
MNSSYIKIEPKFYLTSTQIRKDIIDMLYKAESGHPGGSLSWVEIGNYLFLDGGMKVFADDPEKRDRFVLSKGHGVPTLYSILKHLNIIEPGKLDTLRKADMESPRGESNNLQGHPSIKTPGIEVSTGSLGTGIGIAVGKADALKTRYGSKDERKVFVVTGDGEHQTEELWAAVRDAGKNKLNNLIVYVDHNGLQIDGCVEDISSIYPLREKYKANNWHVVGTEVRFRERKKDYQPEGHDYNWLIDSWTRAQTQEEKPTVIIANTVKGAGIPFMENQVGWHGKAPGKKEYKEAIEHLKKLEKECISLIGV